MFPLKLTLKKKPSVDPSALNCYKPLPKLTFLSDLFTNKIVAGKYFSSMGRNYILIPLYVLLYLSTANGIFKSQILLKADAGNCSVFVLLDFVAFDTIDHSVLLHRLHD